MNRPTKTQTLSNEDLATLDNLADALGMTRNALHSYAGTATLTLSEAPKTQTLSVKPMLAASATDPLRVMADYCANMANPADPACPWAGLYHGTAAAILALTGSDIRAAHS